MKRPTPQDAERRLNRLCDELRAHLLEYKPHETFVDAKLLEWVVTSIEDRAAKKGSLDQAMGLARYRGEKSSKPGKYFTLACEMFGMPKLSWAQRAEKLGFDDVRELQKIWERERDNVLRHYAKQLSTRGVK